MKKIIGTNIIISAPSASGKSTIISKVMQGDDKLCFATSVTTRPKRTGEIHGKEYFFVSKEEFENLIEQNKLLEHVNIFGNYYGTLLSEVEKNLNMGVDVIFDVDIAGANKLQQVLAENSVSIFIMPPAIGELDRRLRDRNTETEEKIIQRLAQATTEIKHSANYDYIVINDDLHEAIDNVKSIINSNRLKVKKILNFSTFIKSIIE